MDPGWIAAAERAIHECYSPTPPARPVPYDIPDWGALSPLSQRSARTLGFDPESWAEGAGTAATELAWAQLSETQRDAASQLGLDAQTWPEPGRATGPMRARPLVRHTPRSRSRLLRRVVSVIMSMDLHAVARTLNA
eukprot:SAG31_NODE_2880_length_4958_cov_4.413460_4_plen_137_part_00